MVALHEARAPQHLLERLLDEVLGVVAGARHRERGTQQPRAVVSQAPRFQQQSPRAHVATPVLRSNH